MTLQDEIDALKIVVGALVKANSGSRATLCLEVSKGHDAALISNRPDLAAAFERWLAVLDCKNI